MRVFLPLFLLRFLPGDLRAFTTDGCSGGYALSGGLRTTIPMIIDPSYESTARFYDAAHAAMPSLGPDAQFYEKLAAEIGGPVLEVGCGTGRVLLPIAARGIECAGIDASPAMLDECRRKPGAGAIALSCARMQSFDLGKRRFRLIYSAFRAFQHLETVDDQLACLARVRAHLEPDGVFAFDVFNPRLERVALDDEPEAQDLVFTRAGRSMRRFTALRRDRATQLHAGHDALRGGRVRRRPAVRRGHTRHVLGCAGSGATSSSTCCTARASRKWRCSAISIAARFAATHPRSWSWRVSSEDLQDDVRGAASVTAFICASPFSNCPPIILSMFMTRWMALAMKLFLPSMLHVTTV